MARPQKEGIDYFPLDVNMDFDDKFQLLEAKYGIIGFGIIVKLFMKIYSNGYYYKWGEKESLLHSKRVNVNINEVNVIINDAIKWGIFDEGLYQKYQILTSTGIQKRFLEAVKRRNKIDIIQDFWLLSAETTINVNINFVNVDIGTQRIVIVKNSKEKNSNSSNTAAENLPEENAVKILADHYLNLTGRLANDQDYVSITEALNKKTSIPITIDSKIKVIKHTMDRLTKQKNYDGFNRIKSFKFFLDAIFEEYKKLELTGGGNVARDREDDTGDSTEDRSGIGIEI